MKKSILIWILVFITCFVFADRKEELEKTINNANKKEFSKANKHIDELQEQGEQYVSQGKYEKALECYKKALVESDKLFGKNSTAAASSYTSMAVPYIKMGKKIKAADSLVKASEIFKKSMGGFLLPKAGRLLLMQAGFLYSDSGSYRKAWQILVKAEKEVQNFSSKEKNKYLGEFYRYLSLALIRDKKYKEAIPYLKKSFSLESHKKTINHKELGIINLFLGEAFLEIDELDKSLLHLKDAEKYLKRYSDEIFFKYRANFKTIGFLLLKFHFSRAKTILTRLVRLFLKNTAKILFFTC